MEPKILGAPVSQSMLALGGYMALTDLEPVYMQAPKDDPKSYIWKARILKAQVNKPSADDIVVFSRKYSPETNDLDKLFPEWHFPLPNDFGIEFWLVPKEHMLFAQGTPSSIKLPDPSLFAGGRGKRRPIQ